MKRAISILLLLLAASASGLVAQQENHLKGSESPYLLQHQDNPVDWYPWGPQALNKAKSENKLILISVGYSSCHWCHVMEDESFMNPKIATLLNRDFVSIKIDRESRPDLDEQFMMATQLLSGGGGWPNTVFLTPDGDPFYSGTYFPPANFQTVITAVRQAWLDDPQMISTEAAKVTRAVGEYLVQKAPAVDITSEIVQSIARDVLDSLDPFNGGYGIVPKFPRESLFLFLLDHAERSGDREVLNAVTNMLDGMIRGGIHDHIGGGFHRYSVDPEWHVPHFEKMLYTQALTGRLLIRAWAMTGKNRYRRTAERLFDYVLRDLRDTKGAFFSAQDADSLNPDGEKAEGVYYTWTPAQLRNLGEDAGFVRDVFQITEEGDIEGTNVLNLSALPDELAANHNLSVADFESRLDEVTGRMMRSRIARPPPFLDRKIVVSWNAMMIQTLAEAGYRLDRPDYIEAAETAARFIRTQLYGPDGLKRVGFEDAAHIPAQLADYAGLGLAFLALHDFSAATTDKMLWLHEARLMAEEIQDRFGAPEDGFSMTQTAEGLTRIVPVDDTEIPSGNALALSLFSRLAMRTQAPRLEQKAFLLAAPLSGLATSIPDQRGYLLKALIDFHEGETGLVRHVAGGNVKVELQLAWDSEEIVLAVSVADGWHVNAHKPLEDYLIATELVAKGDGEMPVEYPRAIRKALSFSGKELALYEGAFEIIAQVAPVGTREQAPQITLTIQACSDEICLQPEDLTFTRW